jgi:ribosome assembly protein YihI (activator of Der GTPase)
MTPEELEAHVARELELRAEIDSFLDKLNNGEYRTKTEKIYLNEQYRAKFKELNIHLGYETEDE